MNATRLPTEMAPDATRAPPTPSTSRNAACVVAGWVPA